MKSCQWCPALPFTAFKAAHPTAPTAKSLLTLVLCVWSFNLTPKLVPAGPHAAGAAVQPRHAAASPGQPAGAADDEWPRQHALSHNLQPTDAGPNGCEFLIWLWLILLTSQWFANGGLRNPFRKCRRIFHNIVYERKYTEHLATVYG